MVNKAALEEDGETLGSRQMLARTLRSWRAGPFTGCPALGVCGAFLSCGFVPWGRDLWPPLGLIKAVGWGPTVN